MSHRQFDGQEFYNFITDWRRRLVEESKKQRLTDEKFGQLLTLNTIVAWVDDHKIPGDA